MIKSFEFKVNHTTCPSLQESAKKAISFGKAIKVLEKDMGLKLFTNNSDPIYIGDNYGNIYYTLQQFVDNRGV